LPIPRKRHGPSDRIALYTFCIVQHIDNLGIGDLRSSREVADSLRVVRLAEYVVAIP
jgi:hypothetical protein